MEMSDQVHADRFSPGRLTPVEQTFSLQGFPNLSFIAITATVMGAGTAQSVQCLGYGLDNRIIVFRLPAETVFRPPLRHTQLPIQYQGAFLWEKSNRCVKRVIHLHLVPRLRMSGAILPLPHIPSRCVWEQLYIYSSDWVTLSVNNCLHNQKCSFRFKYVPVCKYFSFKSYHELCLRGPQVEIIWEGLSLNYWNLVTGPR
jgi:hypothetical protein